MCIVSARIDQNASTAKGFAAFLSVFAERERVFIQTSPAIWWAATVAVPVTSAMNSVFARIAVAVIALIGLVGILMASKVVSTFTLAKAGLFVAIGAILTFGSMWLRAAGLLESPLSIFILVVTTVLFLIAQLATTKPE